MKAFCTPTIDFAKIDIEGAELTLFVPSSRQWLANVKYVYMEAHRYQSPPEQTGDSSGLLLG